MRKEWPHDRDDLIAVETWREGLYTKAISNYIVPEKDPKSKETSRGDVTVYDFSHGTYCSNGRLICKGILQLNLIGR